MCCGDEIKVEEPVTLLGWIAYYDNGQVFISTKTKPEALPEDGLQVLMQYERRNERVRRNIISGYDNYFYCEDPECGWYWGGNNDSIENIFLRYKPKVIIRGKWIHPVKSEKIVNKALAEPIEWKP